MNNLKQHIYHLPVLLTGLLTFLFFQPAAAQTALTMSDILVSAHTLSDPYQSRFFSVGENSSLSVFTSSGNIEVVHTPGIEGIQVDLYVKRGFSFWSGSRSMDNYRIIMQQRGNQVVASVEDRRTGGMGRGSDQMEFTFVVQIPQKVSVNLRSLNGNIILDGAEGEHFIQNQLGNLKLVRSQGTIHAASTTGNIDLEELKGTVYAKTVSGDITLDKAEGEVRFRTVSGRIAAREVKGTLISASTSGDIEAAFAEVMKGISLETVSGDINLSFPAAEGYRIQSQAMGFDMRGFEMTDVSRQVKNNREISIVINEGTLPVHLSTLSGRILLTESN